MAVNTFGRRMMSFGGYDRRGVVAGCDDQTVVGSHVLDRHRFGSVDVRGGHFRLGGKFVVRALRNCSNAPWLGNVTFEGFAGCWPFRCVRSVCSSLRFRRMRRTRSWCWPSSLSRRSSGSVGPANDKSLN